MATNEDEKQEVNKLSIEESREKRLARIKSKQRDRGGIFKPAESNPLIDILLARDASGRSPSKVRRKSLAHGPRKSLGRKNVDSDAPQPQMKRRKSNTPNTGAAASGARKGKRSLGAGDGAIEEEGPSHSSSKHSTLHSSTTKASSSKKPHNKSTEASGSKAVPTLGSKSPAVKRTRDDSERPNTDPVDAPSPPKRMKKANASDTSKPSKSRGPDGDDDEKAELPSKSTRKSPKKARAAGGKARQPKKGSERKQTPRKGKTKSKETNVDSHAEDIHKHKASNASSQPTESTNQQGSVGSARKRAEACNPLQIQDRSEGSSNHRSFISRPDLETVEEEEEDGPVEDSHSPKKQINDSASSSGKRKRSDDNEQQPNKDKEPGPSKRTSATKSRTTAKKTTAKSNPKSKEAKPKQARKPSSSKSKSKQKDPPPSSNPESAEKENRLSASKLSTPKSVKEKETKPIPLAAEKRKPKPRSTQMKWPKKPSEFANLPTTVMNSPIKAVDSDLDELDFLS